MSIDHGHIVYTGARKFKVRNTHIVNFGCTTTDLIDSTKISSSDLNYEQLSSQMVVSHISSNQIDNFLRSNKMLSQFD